MHVCSPDDALGSILVEAPELGGHVGERSQAVGVEILVLLRVEAHKRNAVTFLEIVPVPAGDPAGLTLVRVMLNWMVRMTTRMSRLPREISVSDLSEYHVMFFSTCDSEGHPDNLSTAQRGGDTHKGDCVYPPPRGWSD